MYTAFIPSNARIQLTVKNSYHYLTTAVQVIRTSLHVVMSQNTQFGYQNNNTQITGTYRTSSSEVSFGLLSNIFLFHFRHVLMPLQDLQYGSQTKLSLESLDPSLSLTDFNTHLTPLYIFFIYSRQGKINPRSDKTYKNVVLNISSAWLTLPNFLYKIRCIVI